MIDLSHFVKEYVDFIEQLPAWLFLDKPLSKAIMDGSRFTYILQNIFRDKKFDPPFRIDIENKTKEVDSMKYEIRVKADWLAPSRF